MIQLKTFERPEDDADIRRNEVYGVRIRQVYLEAFLH